MAVMVTTRFEANPSDAEELVTRRNALVSAVRRTCPGLTEARLGRIDEQRWIDSWRWESAESLQSVLETVAAGRLPEREAAFALVRNATGESAEIVDER